MDLLPHNAAIAAHVCLSPDRSPSERQSQYLSSGSLAPLAATPSIGDKKKKSALLGTPFSCMASLALGRASSQTPTGPNIQDSALSY